MKTCGRFSMTFLCCLLAVAVTMMSSPVAYGAPPEVDPGLMTVLGDVRINGNQAKMGGTFISGSTVTTGSDGIVIIELGSLGRAAIGPRTTATVTYSRDKVVITTTCDDMHVSVRQGQCTIRNLKNNDTSILAAVSQEHYDSNVEVSAGPVVDVVVNCGRDVVCPTPVFFPEPSRWLLGLLLLGGAGVVTGVIVKTNAPPRLSDARPVS